METFYLVLQNSLEPAQKLSQVLIPTWDCLITLFFNYHVNSIFFSLFFKIMKIVAEKSDEVVFFNIFIKLNLFSK